MAGAARRAPRGTLAPLSIAGALSLAGLLAALAVAAHAAAPTTAAAKSGVLRHSLLQSRELWATVDVCNPADQRDTIGIRGSMPGDGHAKDTMYMGFQLQYLQSTGGWTDLAHGGSSGFIAVGPAKTARQAGTSFQLMPAPGKPAYTMRGLVTFQWRSGSKVVHQATRTTSAGHTGVADADPAGYSAARCAIGAQ